MRLWVGLMQHNRYQCLECYHLEVSQLFHKQNIQTCKQIGAFVCKGQATAAARRAPEPGQQIKFHSL